MQLNSSLDAALPPRRRADLLQLVRSRRQVTVSELAAAFEVSADTIRRDLDYLHERGLLTRTHGGAVAGDELATWTPPFIRRRDQHADAKERIGRLAASLVTDGETVLINGGTTTLAVAQSLGGRRDLTIVTNHLSLPTALPPDCARDVYVVGGQYRPESLVTIGPLELPGSRGISVDRAIIGVGGVSADGGLSTTILAEGRMMAEMLQAAPRRVVVADSSKFGHNVFAHIAPLSEIDTLVTDAEPDPALASALHKAQVEVLIAR
jgi:DeoR family transcriptional regulator, fructose operon transcriptional repressor